MLLAISDDVLCSRGVQTGHAPQQGGGGRVQIDADGVDAILHHAGERLVELLFRHVVLILTDANGLRVDLDQLGQWVLQPPRDGDRAAQVDIVLRKFASGEAE